MTITALSVIVDAYERCNRLSPGETLAPDSADFGFRRLNKLVDKLSARSKFLYKSVLTTVTQTGHITLGTGSWAAISPGEKIEAMSVNGIPMARLTMQQYNSLQTLTTSGSPEFWAQDGLSTVYLYPVPVAQSLRVLTLTGVADFADQTTAYTVPPGWEAALGALLAVALAPSVMGQIPIDLKLEAKACLSAVDAYEPTILDVDSYNKVHRRSNILVGP